MSQTQVPAGSPLARKIFGAALFAQTIRAPGFSRNITGTAPKQSDAEAKMKGQTSPDMPIVRVTDLSKTAGDTVSVDMFNTVRGKPIIGDENAAEDPEAKVEPKFSEVFAFKHVFWIITIICVIVYGEHIFLY